MRLLNIALILAVVAATMAHAGGPQCNLKSSTDKPPDKVVRWFVKATRAMGRDDNSAAIVGFDRVIAACPMIDAAIYNRALVLAEMGRDREAMADLARLRQLASPQADKLAALFLFFFRRRARASPGQAFKPVKCKRQNSRLQAH